jgi:hypothetical protein
MLYEAIEPVSREVAEQVASRATPDALSKVILAVALHEADRGWAEQFCLRFAGHTAPRVRAAALLGFGHLARRFRYLDRFQIEPFLQAGLADPNAWVKGQAETALNDIAFFLGWQLRRS